MPVTETMWAPGADIPDWARDDDDDAGNDARTVDQLREDWLLTVPSMGTRRKYRINVNHYLRWMALHNPRVDALAEAQFKHLERFQRYLKSPHAEGHPGDCGDRCRTSFPHTHDSARVIVSAVASFFDYVIRSERRAAVNPARGLPGKASVTKEESEQEVEAAVILTQGVADYMEAADSLAPMYSIIGYMGLGMGMRCAEMGGARAEGWRLYPDGVKRLTFKRKGGDWATLEVPPTMVAPLDNYLDGRTEGPILLPTRGSALARFNWEKGLSESSVYRAVVMTCLEGEVLPEEQAHTHITRISSITMAYTVPGLAESRISDYYGHDNISTSRGYRRAKKLVGNTHYPNPVGIDWLTQAA